MFRDQLNALTRIGVTNKNSIAEEGAHNATSSFVAGEWHVQGVVYAVTTEHAHDMRLATFGNQSRGRDDTHVLEEVHAMGE